MAWRPALVGNPCAYLGLQRRAEWSSARASRMMLYPCRNVRCGIRPLRAGAGRRLPAMALEDLVVFVVGGRGSFRERSMRPRQRPRLQSKRTRPISSPVFFQACGTSRGINTRRWRARRRRPRRCHDADDRSWRCRRAGSPLTSLCSRRCRARAASSPRNGPGVGQLDTPPVDPPKDPTQGRSAGLP